MGFLVLVGSVLIVLLGMGIIWSCVFTVGMATALRLFDYIIIGIIFSLGTVMVVAPVIYLSTHIDVGFSIQQTK